MHFRTRDLCRVLDRYKRIIIYGTGNYAQQIYRRMVRHGLREKIFCFVQSESNASGPDLIDEIPIITISELDCNKTACVVLIAVSELYVDEIKQILLEYGYLNYVSLIEYVADYKKSEEIICQLSTLDEYCEYIADWYIETDEGNLDRAAVVNELLTKRDAKNKKVNANLIVILCGYITMRSIKIINALNKRGFDIVLLDYCPNTFEWCLNSLQQTDVKRHKCCCIEEMLYWVLQYAPQVYFVEPRWGDCLWPTILLKIKNHLGKIVISLYDVLNDGYLDIPQIKLKTEKFALENADGIVWRWFSKDYLESRGFKYKGESIQFLDYCADVYNTSSSKIEQDSQVLKLCMVNSIGDVYVETRADYTGYTDAAKIEEILKVLGNRKDCIFHYYVGSLKEENIKLCKGYEKQYRNFKLFLSTEHDELIGRLKQYDYGCDLYTGGKWPSNDVSIGRYKGSCWDNCIRNTWFEYINAGLPIVGTVPAKFLDYLQQFGIVVKMDISNIDIEYLKREKYSFKEKVEVARKKLNMDRQILRLIDFFKEI